MSGTHRDCGPNYINYIMSKRHFSWDVGGFPTAVGTPGSAQGLFFALLSGIRDHPGALGIEPNVTTWKANALPSIILLQPRTKDILIDITIHWAKGSLTFISPPLSFSSQDSETKCYCTNVNISAIPLPSLPHYQLCHSFSCIRIRALWEEFFGINIRRSHLSSSH